MTVLVLSATGTTGRSTVRALLQRGAQVRAATRSPDSARFDAAVSVVRFDLMDRGTWTAALTGVQALYFCLSTELTGAVEQSLALIERAEALGVKRIVTLSAYRADLIEYAPHYRFEQAIEASGMQWIHLRPNFFADNFPRLLSPDGRITLPAGTGRTSFVAASDIGASAAEGLLGVRHGETWTLTGPEALDHVEVASILGGVLQRDLGYDAIPREAFTSMLTQYAGVPLQKAEQLSAVYADAVASDLYAPVSQDITRVLGRPAMSFVDWAMANTKSFGAVERSPS